MEPSQSEIAFYERQGFTQAFVVYYGKRNAPAAPD